MVGCAVVATVTDSAHVSRSFSVFNIADRNASAIRIALLITFFHERIGRVVAHLRAHATAANQGWLEALALLVALSGLRMLLTLGSDLHRTWPDHRTRWKSFNG